MTGFLTRLAARVVAPDASLAPRRATRFEAVREPAALALPASETPPAAVEPRTTATIRAPSTVLPAPAAAPPPVPQRRDPRKPNAIAPVPPARPPVPAPDSRVAAASVERVIHTIARTTEAAIPEAPPVVAPATMIVRLPPTPGRERVVRRDAATALPRAEPPRSIVDAPRLGVIAASAVPPPPPVALGPVRGTLVAPRRATAPPPPLAAPAAVPAPVHITIGRIEVRGAAAPTPPARRAAPAAPSAPSLADYLNQRGTAARR